MRLQTLRARALRIGSILALAAFLFSAVAGTPLPAASDEAAIASLVIYVVPAITNERILPDTTLPEGLISNEITMMAAPGEYEPASFVLRAREDISDLRVEPTGLVSDSGFLPADVIDIRVVKCWYQAGDSKFKEGIRVLMPELLLKDDALVKVEDGENYLKVGDEYLWISSPDGTIPGVRWMPTPEQLPIRDAATLQPVDIPAGTNKQFWIMAHVPADAAPGTYSGKIVLTVGQTSVGEATLRLRVLPFTLAEPFLTYSMYYDGQLQASGEGSISSRGKTESQLRAEFRNLLEHGVTNPVVAQSLDDLALLQKYLRIMRESGMSTTPLFFRSGGKVEDANLGFGIPLDPEELAALETKAREVIALAQAEGFSNVYFYGVCEALGQHNSVELLTSQRAAWEAIHRAGGKVFDSGVRVGAYSDERQPGNFGFMGDIQDLLNCNGVPSAEEAARWHSMGHKIFCYSNPQAGLEKPETYRRNFGLLLWQADYDGAMDYAYQAGRIGNIWNDWRSPDQKIRNRAMAYPTADGVIDTIQWEGWREGVDDVRYLTTLLNAIEMAKAQGKDTAPAEEFVAGLKQTNLGTEDLDAVRARIIGHVLRLQGHDVPVDASALSASPVSYRSAASSPFSISLKNMADSAMNPVAYGPIETGIVIESALPATAFVDLDKSLVGWWRFDEESDLKDHSTHSNDAKDRGTVYAPDGKFGGARIFKGGDQILKCRNAESLNVTGGLTIEMWVKPEGGSTDYPRFIDKTSAYYVGWRLVGASYSHPFFSIFSGGKQYTRYFGTPLPFGSFTHLVGVYDASTGRIDCYTNGVLDNDATQEMPLPGSKIDMTESDLRIGTNFIGMLDEVRIWNRALSAAEVRALYDVRAINTPFVFSNLGPGTHGYSAYAVDATGRVVSTEVRSVTLKSGECLAFTFLPRTTQVSGPSDMFETFPQPDFIAWSPYESPENSGDLGVYLMGKGEGSSESERDLAASPGISLPEHQSDIASAAAKKDSSWLSTGRVAYLVAAVAGVSAFFLWGYRRRWSHCV